MTSARTTMERTRRNGAPERASRAEGTTSCGCSDPSAESDAEQLAELDRLRIASLLSAGLAHEVANPLLAVLANLSEMERIYPRLRTNADKGDDERWSSLAECLQQAHRSADAIADVIRDFQVFLRPSSNRGDRLVEPAPLVERALRMAYPRLRVTAQVRTSIAKTPTVKAAPSFITQIALNLLTNAAEALAPSPHERNRIEVRLSHVGTSVVLEVEDNGPGMSHRVASTVFEPHVTTKTAGTSLGLGLSICRALVLRLGGTITVESTPGKRTCFRVTLPVTEANPKP